MWEADGPLGLVPDPHEQADWTLPEWPGGKAGNVEDIGESRGQGMK